MRFKKYLLLEKTFRIGADVDMLYNKFFKKHVKNYNKKEDTYETFLNNLNRYKKDNNAYLFGEISSGELKSKQCKKAHELNPVIIKAGVFSTSSYDTINHTITLSLNSNVISILNDPYYMFRDNMPMRLGSDFEKFNNEISVSSIKGTIYHELSHWLDDTFHNMHITKKINKAKEANDYKKVHKGWSSVNFTSFETDAQVHAIKQLKRDVGNKNWDKITWSDVITKKPSFGPVFSMLKSVSKKEAEEYKRNMLKRLNREKLLGKGLRNSFNDVL